ncbi:MAG: hypothetical protein U9N77_10115 [Thermodesulfobacteriota bacterium]|nr:hypothetical protein [Thermodesulfobacteriota bacterium]
MNKVEKEKQEKRIIYKKLIRNKIPAIISKSGKTSFLVEKY